MDASSKKPHQVSVSEGIGHTNSDFQDCFLESDWTSDDQKAIYPYVLLSDRIHDRENKPYHMYKIKSAGGVKIDISTRKRECEQLPRQPRNGIFSVRKGRRCGEA